MLCPLTLDSVPHELQVAEQEICGRAMKAPVSPPKDQAAAIAEHFRAYNEEFGRITRRAALNFLAEDWRAAQLDAVARIELYEQRVTGCVKALDAVLTPHLGDSALWAEIKRSYEILVARRPDSDFYRTFFNSVTRDLFGTVGVNPDVEFCSTTVGRASGPCRSASIGSEARCRRGARNPGRSAVRRRDAKPGRRGAPGSAPRSAVISRPEG